MKAIKKQFLAMIIACFTIPAWAKAELIPFEEQYRQDVEKIFISTFRYVPYLDYQRYKILIWKDKNEIKGVIIFSEQSPKRIHICYLAVHKDFQHQGIGTQILQALEKELASTYIYGYEISLNAVAKAVNFYTKYGFDCNDFFCLKRYA